MNPNKEKQIKDMAESFLPLFNKNPKAKVKLNNSHAISGLTEKETNHLRTLIAFMLASGLYRKVNSGKDF